MVTLLLTPEPLNAPPRVRLDLDTEDPASVFTALSATRNGVLLRNQPEPGGAESVVFDYDAPYGVNLDYVVEGRYLPPVSPDWTEAWASLAAWTGDTADFSVSGGKARSSVLNADIVRAASGAIGQISVTDPSFVRIELLTAGDVLVGSVEVGSTIITVTGTSSTSVTGAGSFTLTLADDLLLVSGSGWSTSVPYTGAPTKVRVVGLGVSYVPGLEFTTTHPPFGMAVDGSGNIYVCTDLNPANRLLRKYNAAGVQTLSFSTTGSPRGVAVDGAGNIYVVEDTNNLVRKYNAAGVQTLSFSTTGGPSGVTVDGAGNIYVADTTAKLIRKYNSAGVAGITFTTTGTPFDVDVDGSGNIYVADQQNKLVRKYNAAGTQTTSFASTVPFDIALDSSNNVYTADWLNREVHKYTTTTPSVGAISVSLGGAELEFVVTASTTLEVDSGWLIHPTTPGLSVQIDGGPDGPRCGPGCTDDSGMLYLDPASESSVNYAASATVHQIAGSNLPVVVSSGRRKAGTWTLIVQSCDTTGRDILMALLDDQQPLLLNVPDSWDYDLPMGWFAVGDVDESRITNQNMRLPNRVMALPMQPVAEPSLVSAFGHTWGDLLTENLTWQGVLDTYGTWLNVLLGEPV